MKSKEFIDEIITNPARDEYIDYKSVYFANQPVLVKIRELVLKKSQQVDSLKYGLVDKDDNLVGILQLHKHNDKLWQVELVQIAQAYKDQGYGTFLYDYAIMNDGLSILSDSMNSEGGRGGSKGLWERLYRQGRYTVCGYDLKNDVVLPDATPHDVYNQSESIIWLATPKSNPETINEMLTRLNKNSKHTIVWYGPTIVGSGCF